MADDAEPHGRGRYGHLRDVAAHLLAAAPEGLDDGSLARGLFGAAADARWNLLLVPILAADPRFRKDGERWHLRPSAATARPPLAQPRAPTIRPSLSPVASAMPMSMLQAATEPASPEDDAADAPILALALTTTGADPRRHRIARIAVVRRERGDVRARFDSEIGGDWRTGWRGQPALDHEPGEALPTLDEILPALREIVDGRAIYAYGARRAGAFLNAEARRANLPALDLRLAELDDRLRELLPDNRKPGLLAAADELGIPDATRASALGEADLVARVAERLRERQAASPGRAAIARAPTLASNTDDGPLPFTAAWLAGVPEGPGAYIMDDAAGSALYIGKAVSLRRRLADYVSRPLSLHRRFEALGVRAASVRTIVAMSDLEATLLEGRLIRRLQPTFNVARETRGPASVIRAAPDDPSPRVRAVAEQADDGARYFGPFESASAARKALDIARAVYPAAFERRQGDVPVQRQAVLAVCRLLSGQKSDAVAALRGKMSAAAASGDRTEVDRLRAALRGVQGLDIKPSMLVGLPPGWRLLVFERLWTDGPGRLHLIGDGRLVASADTDISALPDDRQSLLDLADEVVAAADLDRLYATGEDADTDLHSSWSADDSTILMRWLAQARQRIEVARLPTTASDEDG
jgi:hypothetical protein